jgi:hypothetical protein
MPVDNKVDPFKPLAPAIPGVPADGEKSEKAPTQQPAQPRVASAGQTPAAREARAKAIGVAVGIAVIVVAGIGFFNSVHNSTAKSNAPLSFDAAAPASPAAGVKAEPAGNLLVGPGPIATVGDLAKPWSSKEFLFRGTLSAEPVPAMVVRLPGGELWGFSLREPFGECELQYVTNLQTLETDYGFHAEHPMVVNPCTRAVYDLTRYGGGAPNGGLVRGDIVHGSGVRPPMAIEIRTSGRNVIAVRGE